MLIHLMLNGLTTLKREDGGLLRHSTRKRTFNFIGQRLAKVIEPVDPESSSGARIILSNHLSRMR